MTDEAVLAEVRELHSRARQYYWEEKNLAMCRSMSEAALAVGIGSESLEVLSATKAVCYDLASFCWPGWNEPGIVITEVDLATGERAAEDNLRFAIELERPDERLAYAHWLVGAYHLARGRAEAAQASFRTAHRFAESAEQPGLALLMDGYGAIASDPNDLPAITARLRSEDPQNGAFYADQLDTALRVFSPEG